MGRTLGESAYRGRKPSRDRLRARNEIEHKVITMQNNIRGPFVLLGSREVYRNPWLHLREDTVLRPGGTEGVFGIIEMKAGSSVLALTQNGDIFLSKEYKYGIGRESLECVSGAIEDGEQPLDAAKRELREELGLVASEWIDLGVVDPFTTVVNSPNHMFLAIGAERDGDQNLDEGEVVEASRVPFSAAIDLVMRGHITHSASCVLILKADKYLRERTAQP